MYHPLQRIPLRDALLHALVVNKWLFELVSTLSSLVILIWPLTLTRDFLSENCCSPDVFYFPGPCLWTTKLAVWENPSRSAVFKILKSACLESATMPCSPFFPIQMFFIILTMSTCPNALRCCPIIGSLDICINKQLNRCSYQSGWWVQISADSL